MTKRGSHAVVLAAALLANLATSGQVMAQQVMAQQAPPGPVEPPRPPETPAEAAVEPRELPAQQQTEVTALLPVAGGLTADQVAARTLTNSATVRAKQAELEAAHAQIRQTTVRFFPRLTLTATYTRLSPVSADFGSGALVGAQNAGQLEVGPCPSGAGQCVLDAGGVPVGASQFAIQMLENNYALTASLVVPLSDYVLRLSNAIAASKASKRAAELALQAEQLQVQSDSRVLYYQWLQSLGQVEAAQKSLERTRARLDDARAAYQLGTISKADLMRLEALLANTELVVKEAETFRELAAQQLAIVMGDAEPPIYRVGEDIRTPAGRWNGSTAGLVSEALGRRLELRALRERETTLLEGAKATEAGKWPRLDAFADATYANPNSRFFPPQQEWNATWALGASATWTIGDVFIQDAAADELRANAAAVHAQHRALRDAIRREVVAAKLEHDKFTTAIQTSQRALEAAEEAYRVATDLYRYGRATTTELIEAESDLLNARLAALNARIQQRISAARLGHAVGRDVQTLR